MIRRPKSIKPGDTIGVTAPSYGAATEPYSLRYPIAKENISGRGYKIIDGATVFKSDGIGISTDPLVAAKELVDFYKIDDIDAIISAGGGELMNETISHIDFYELKNCDPKWFMGYSDNTNFIFPMVTIAEVQGIYGPCIGGFAKEWEETENDAFSLLEGSKSSFDGYRKFIDPMLVEPEEELSEQKVYTDKELRAPLSCNADRQLKCFKYDGNSLVQSKDGKVQTEGILLGGCLDVLANMVGTRFDNMKAFNEKCGKVIWVLEACDLSPMSIRRSMWNLREAGWFDNAAGFLIGRPLASWKKEMLGADQYNAVTDVIGQFKVPVIMDAEIGHVEPMLPVIMGAEARVTVKDNDLNITYI